MKPYELLEHTADAKFRAFGRTVDEAFSNAVSAMTAIIAEPHSLATERVMHISIKANTLQQLLFDLLDEILFLHDTEHFLPARAQKLTIVERDGRLVLDATLLGDDARKWPGNLKAVTYSDMVIEQKDNHWVLEVVIDI
jgi:SHS2 domain-containing protein